MAASTLRRSVAEQVEYWADIGRKVSKLVNPSVLLEIQAGLSTLQIEKTLPVMANPNAVFAQLDSDRESGGLSRAIASGSVCYQASHNAPGKLEAVHPNGHVEMDGLSVDNFV